MSWFGTGASGLNYLRPLFRVPFFGRFKSCLVDSDRYLLSVIRYIELNPVRAGMVAGGFQRSRATLPA